MITTGFSISQFFMGRNKWMSISLYIFTLFIIESNSSEITASLQASVGTQWRPTSEGMIVESCAACQSQMIQDLFIDSRFVELTRAGAYS